MARMQKGKANDNYNIKKEIVSDEMFVAGHGYTQESSIPFESR